MSVSIDLRLGDCLEIMRDLPDGCVDAVVTDPPYHVTQPGVSFGGVGGGRINMDFGKWDEGAPCWRTWLPECLRMLGPCGVFISFNDRAQVGCMAHELETKHGFTVRHIGAYVKTNPPPQVFKVKWRTATELFVVATRNKGRGHHFAHDEPQTPDYYMRSNCYPRQHPTQKPQDLMEWIVRYWSWDNDVIFDPFMGSGTTGVACVETGRNFIGCEINPEYFAIAERRIAEAQRNYQPALALA